MSKYLVCIFMLFLEIRYGLLDVWMVFRFSLAALNILLCIGKLLVLTWQWLKLIFEAHDTGLIIHMWVLLLVKILMLEINLKLSICLTLNWAEKSNSVLTYKMILVGQTWGTENSTVAAYVRAFYAVFIQGVSGNLYSLNAVVLVFPSWGLRSTDGSHDF